MQALHISAEHKKLVILGGLMGEGVGSWAAKTELQQRRMDGWCWVSWHGWYAFRQPNGWVTACEKGRLVMAG